MTASGDIFFNQLSLVVAAIVMHCGRYYKA